MSLFRMLALPLLALPLGAQTWDVRLEIPFPKGQNLPQTLVGGAIATRGDLDTGQGYIASFHHRIIRFGPILRFDWSAEAARFSARGEVVQGADSASSHLTQTGFGLGIHAQLNVPFTGLSGELGLIQRFHDYRFEGAGARQDANLSRLWLKVGLRYRIPMPLVDAFLLASYQQPTRRDKPVHLQNSADLASYFKAQGTGQEVSRMWTFGVGVGF